MLLRNKISIFIIFILLASTVAGQVMCEVDDVLECLKKSLYDFLINPDSPNTRPVEEIKDLLTYYLGISPETVTVNCAQDKGAYTDRYISEIMDDIGECIFNIQCADGTTYAECSPTPPKYCYAGTIIDNCAICGCPTDNQICDPITGQCQSTQETIQCIVDSDCGTNGYIGDPMCDSNDNVYRQYQSYICQNPNTPQSYCDSTTTDVIIENCIGECSTGQCQSTQDIQCIIDSDCGSDIASPPTCGQDPVNSLNYVYYTLIRQICQNPNTPQSYCDSEETNVTIEYCIGGCSNGVCLPPTLITTCQELQNMKNDLTADYVLSNNIDCSATTTWNGGQGFEPIGDYGRNLWFNGTFNGRGYSISNLYINRPSEDDVGLFGVLMRASVSDVKLENVNIEGRYRVGALAGGYTFDSTITKIKSSGQVTGDQFVGGLVGHISRGSISDSFSTCEVTGNNKRVGGLLGAAMWDEGVDHSEISILNTYSTGDVSGTNYTGGLIGTVLLSTITNSYSTSNVNSPGDVGGLIGDVSSNPPLLPQITNSYFTDDDDNGLGTFEPLGQSAFYGSSHAVYSGWDFTNIWQSNSGSYPTLR